MASFLRYSCRLSSLSSRAGLSSLCNLPRRQLMRPTFEKSVFPLVEKNFLHSSSSCHQQTVAKTDPPGLPHWKTFRYVSVIMIGLYPAAILAPTPVVDWGIAIFFPLHSYWGTKEILSDYVPQVFSNKAVKTTAVYTWAGVSALTFLGLAYLNVADVGVCNAVSMLWKL